MCVIIWKRTAFQFLTSPACVISWIVVWNLKFQDECEKWNSQSFSPKSYIIHNAKISYKYTIGCVTLNRYVFSLMWMCSFVVILGAIDGATKWNAFQFDARHSVIINSQNNRILNVLVSIPAAKRCTNQPISSISIQIGRTEKKSQKQSESINVTFFCIIHIIIVVRVANKNPRENSKLKTLLQVK